MRKANNVKIILKITSILLVLLQLSCVQKKKRENIIVASAGKIESLDPAQANTLRTLQILSAVGDTLYKTNKEGNLSPSLAKDLPKIKTHTCLIWGKDDIVTPPDVANEFHKLLPNSDLYWIDKCGHAPMMEHPNVFNETVVKWFSKRNLNTAS